MSAYDGNRFMKDLRMGDMFRFPGDTVGQVYGPVRYAESDYMLYGTTAYLAGGVALDRHAFTRVEVTKEGPSCACGRSYELCERECPWPDWLEALYVNV